MKISTKTLAFIVLVFASAQAHCQVVTKEMMASEVRGAWTSFILGSPPSDFVFRASSEARQTLTTIAVDFTPATCASNISFIFPYNQPLDKDINTVSVSIDARVDAGRMFYLGGFLSGSMGDKYGMLKLKPTSHYGDLIDAMKAGNTIRFKVTAADGSYISTEIFSLIGFTYSVNRIFGACGSQRPDATPKREPNSPASPGLRSLMYQL